MDTFDLTKDPAGRDSDRRTAHPRQSRGQSDRDQLRRPGMSLLRAHAPGAVSRHDRPLQRPGAVRLQGRSADRSASLGDARSRGRQLPGRAEQRRLLDLRGLPSRSRARRSRATATTWRRALRRWIASPGRKPRWASSMRPRSMPASPSRTKRRCELRPSWPKTWASMERRRCL